MRVQAWALSLSSSILVLLFSACQTSRHGIVDQKPFVDKYLKAKADAQPPPQAIAGTPASACDEFTELSKEKDFVLRDLAKLRAQEACLKEAIDYASYPSWIRPAALDAAVSSAQKRNDLAILAPLALEKSRQPLNREDRLQWASLARDLATKQNLKSLADKAQDRIYVIAPRLKPQPAEKEYLAVADDYRYNREFDKAENYYEKVIDNTSAPWPEKVSAFKGLRFAYKNARDNTLYMETNERLIDFLDKRIAKARKRTRLMYRQLSEAMGLQARALWTSGRIKDATKAIEEYEKKLNGHWPLTEIYWLKARMAEEKGDAAKTGQYLNLALKQAGPADLDTKDKLNWIMAWTDRRQKNYAAAEAALNKLMTETQSESVRYRAEFWLGKVRSEMNHADAANQIWEKLTNDDPLGYYGLLAYHELQKPILQNKKPTEPAVSLAALKGADQLLHPEIADVLLQVNENDVLQVYLDEIARNYKKAKGLNDDIWVKLLKSYARAGLYLRLYENLNQISSEQRTTILANNPELLFPRPFSEEVKQAATDLQIEPELVYAIMRQESAFNPKARSAADAFGLMQIVPEVASQLSQKYKIQYSKNEDLYDPSLNIRFGAALIKDQLKRYHDQFILAVASYNANDNAIRNWMTSRFHGDALEFIEDIPYEETRSYVRLVMRNLVFYRLLSSKDPSMAFPQWVLQLSSTDR